MENEPLRWQLDTERRRGLSVHTTVSFIRVRLFDRSPCWPPRRFGFSSRGRRRGSCWSGSPRSWNKRRPNGSRLLELKYPPLSKLYRLYNNVTILQLWKIALNFKLVGDETPPDHRNPVQTVPGARVACRPREWNLCNSAVEAVGPVDFVIVFKSEWKYFVFPVPPVRNPNKIRTVGQRYLH